MTDFPSAYITGVTRALRSAVLATESPFSFTQQVQDMGGERWEFSIDVMVEDFGFEAFANSVLGKRLPFDLVLPKAGQHFAVLPDLAVEGAGQSGNALTVSGHWYGNTLQPGTFFSLAQGGRQRLYQITSAAVNDPANPLDPVTLQIVPRLRGAPAAGALLNFTPKVSLRATGPVPATIGHVVHQFSIEAVEAL
ncbi:hypothetical protein ACFOHK_08175 [Falsigemmobacter intermedius]|uniref:Uncharacterized protein n=1 Tax=Falsigemmobacter intermedius TaxID=1553448 RepID=A0A3S3VIE0_9RHOB|nr:hypothetical protein [Falsigemmobacter intermedius]RWY36427.1 hypothetical protein EP867_17855 [Falsigemmobacter intermedius]